MAINPPAYIHDLGAPAPGHMVPAPRSLPVVNISIDSNINLTILQAALRQVDELMNPQNYQAAPMPEEVHDQYGTRLDLLRFNDTYDREEHASAMQLRGTMVSAMSMLCMRMQWGPFNPSVAERDAFNPTVPFDHLSIHRTPEKAIVFIVAKGEPVTLTDDNGLFPSDQLVGQIRLLEERQK